MTELLETLKAIDPAILQEVVRQDQNDPSFEITSWDVKRLSDKGIAFPDGLWLFSGSGGNDSRQWSIVLKILNRPQEEPAAQNLWAYWKREFHFMQSNLPNYLPRLIKMPRVFRMEEQSNAYWIWMEHIVEHQPVWTLEDYAFAARQLGLWNGIYLTGISLPSATWLAQQHYRSWLDGTDMIQDFQFPLNQKYITSETRLRFERLWHERDVFFSTLERLPQVFSHFDSQRRNLFMRTNHSSEKELVLLDWGQCGIGAVGAELNWLVGFSAALLEWSPTQVVQLEEVAFPSYVQGLQQSGWSGNIDLARLGFTAMIAVYIGCVLPSFVTFWCAPENNGFAKQQFDLAEEELYIEWLPFIQYSLERADEAQVLMKKLGYK